MELRRVSNCFTRINCAAEFVAELNNNAEGILAPPRLFASSQQHDLQCFFSLECRMKSLLNFTGFDFVSRGFHSGLWRGRSMLRPYGNRFTHDGFCRGEAIQAIQAR